LGARLCDFRRQDKVEEGVKCDEEEKKGNEKKLGKCGKSATELCSFEKLQCFVIRGCMTEKSKGRREGAIDPLSSTSPKRDTYKHDQIVVDALF
jgi:hypothetical protein